MRRLGWLVLTAVACDRAEPVALPQRTETSEQVERLRADNEKELHDLRGKWLAAEGALVGLQTELNTQRATAERQAEQARTDRVGLEGQLAELEAVVDELQKTPRVAPPRSEPLNERVLRAYEELACAARRGAFESVPLVRARWGFESAEAWALAWIQVARDPDFERAASERIARLCP